MEEFESDTDHSAPADHLEVVDFSPRKSPVILTWTSRPTRLYRIFHSTDLQQCTASVLNDIHPDPGETTSRAEQQPPGSRCFYRVKAVLPLQP